MHGICNRSAPALQLRRRRKHLLQSVVKSVSESSLRCALPEKQVSLLFSSPRKVSSPTTSVIPGRDSSPRILTSRGGPSRHVARTAAVHDVPSFHYPPPEGTLQASELRRQVLQALQNAGSFLPQAIVASTSLALLHPPSFTWFGPSFYAPALGFLMFAVGINMNPQDFSDALSSPAPIALGFLAQFSVKPLLGCLLAATLVPALGLPEAVGSGLILVSCVSGAQLSNYATFLVDPPMAALSILLTALSTASAALITPALSLLLLGQRLPVSFAAMAASITQIVLLPISLGLLINRFFSPLSSALRPFLPALALLTTSLCVGSPLALNADVAKSSLGLYVAVPVLALHASAFLAGYLLSLAAFPSRRDIARTISFETGMQSSLLALALANKFFPDPLVSLPPALSVIVMSLMGFGMVVIWTRLRKSLFEKHT